MKKIELSVSTAMSLNVNSSSGSEEEEEENAVENPALSMSDEDFENMSEDEAVDLILEENSLEGDDEDDDEDYEDDEDLGDDEEDDSDYDADDEEDEDAAADEDSSDAEDEDDNSEDQPSDLSKDEADAYKNVYNQLFGQPIKASGREFQLRDATQARNLIEMGVDYNKKMQHMKPYLPVLKTLEKKGLVNDVEKLNLALEIMDGNPNAIKRIIADKNIDVLDLADDTEGSKEYIPQNQIVPESEYRIDEALAAIRESPVYDKTINVMANQFDNGSKKIIADNPEYISALNSDIASGLYDTVMANVQYKRDTRMINDQVSDIEAYIQTLGEMAEFEQQQATQQQQQQPNQQIQQPAAQRRKSNKRKTSMSSSRTRTTATEQNFDPLSLSDEEFMKLDGMDLL